MNMEYNYTKEFKHPHKIYGIKGQKIPWISNGIRMEQLVIGGIFLLVLLILFFIAYVNQISFLQTLFQKSWLIMLFGIGVLVWTLFSMKWDNKNFFEYLVGRTTYYKKRKQRFEHEMYVPFFHEKVTYSLQKWKE